MFQLLDFSENPILVREYRAFMRKIKKWSMSVWRMVLFSIIVAPTFIGLTVVSFSVALAGGNEIMFAVLATLQATVVWFVTPSTTSSTVILEKKQGTWESLILTGLDIRLIIVGKMIGRLLPLFAMLSSFFPAMLLLSLNIKMIYHLPLFYASLITQIISFGLVGFWASSRFNSIFTANFVSYTIIVLVTVFTYMVFGFLSIFKYITRLLNIPSGILTAISLEFLITVTSIILGIIFWYESIKSCKKIE